MAFFGIRWAWMNFTWFASAYDPDDIPYRLTVFVQMTGVLPFTAGIESMFSRGSLGLAELCWVGVLLLPEQLVAAIFFALCAVELVIPVWAERGGSTPWHRHHIAERYGRMTIIVLGESILAATTATQQAIATVLLTPFTGAPVPWTGVALAGLLALTLTVRRRSNG